MPDLWQIVHGVVLKLTSTVRDIFHSIKDKIVNRRKSESQEDVSGQEPTDPLIDDVKTMKIMLGCILFVLLVVYPALFAYLLFGHFDLCQRITSREPILREDITEKIDAKPFDFALDKIKMESTSQNPRLWDVVQSQMNRIVERRSTKPSCILLMHDSDKAERVSDIVANIGTTVKDFLTSGNLKENNFRALDSNDFSNSDEGTKGQLYRALEKHVLQHKVAAVLHLEKLPAKTALALQGICDESFHQMKGESLQPMIFFSLKVDHFSKSSIEGDYEIAKETLKNLWGNQLSSDYLYPLINRVATVAVSVIIDS